MRRAVIDIGSNSVKALVANVSGSCVEPVWEASEQTRLAAGAGLGMPLQPGPVAATAAAVARLAERVLHLGSEKPRVFATSAARESSNPELLAAAIRAICGLEIEVISGSQEAALSFRGACTLPSLGAGRVLVIDVGGGSTELAAGLLGRLDFSTSLTIGAVRMMEALSTYENPTPADLARARALARATLERGLSSWPLFSVATAVGVGGTPIILAQVVEGRTITKRDWRDGARLTDLNVHSLTERLWATSLSARRSLAGLPAERADVILFGAVLYEALMGFLGLKEIRVSSRGLRFGALLP